MGLVIASGAALFCGAHGAVLAANQVDEIATLTAAQCAAPAAQSLADLLVTLADIAASGWASELARNALAENIGAADGDVAGAICIDGGLGSHLAFLGALRC